MAAKKNVKSENAKVENTIDVKVDNGKLTLKDVSIIVDTVVNSSFAEINGKIEYNPEISAILIPYLEVGAFYPETEVFNNGDNSLEIFFNDYIDGKYDDKLNELGNNRLAAYIEDAIRQKIEHKLRQIENPLINSVINLIDNISTIANAYAKDIDNIGTSDIKKFISDFADFAKITNPRTITDSVVDKHIQLLQSGTIKEPPKTTRKKKTPAKS